MSSAKLQAPEWANMYMKIGIGAVLFDINVTVRCTELQKVLSENKFTKGWIYDSSISFSPK